MSKDLIALISLSHGNVSDVKFTTYINSCVESPHGWLLSMHYVFVKFGEKWDKINIHLIIFKLFLSDITTCESGVLHVRHWYLVIFGHQIASDQGFSRYSRSVKCGFQIKITPTEHKIICEASWNQKPSN